MKRITKANIIPTIFSHNKKEFENKFEKIKNITKKIQIDLMDGVFVKDKSIEPRYIPNLSKYKQEFEAHLMVMNPQKYFEKIKNKGFKKIICHIESFNSTNDAKKFFEELKKQKIKTVIAINPQTRLDEIIINEFDFFLLMGVQPGQEHQTLKKSVYTKIKKIKKEKPTAKIQIDGGVNSKNTRKLFKAGADYLNSGSYISSNEEPERAIKQLIY